MASWGRSFGVEARWRAARQTLCAVALASSGCGLYVSEREGLGDGGQSGGSSNEGGSNQGDQDGGTTLVDAGCHPEDPACGYRFKREVTFDATFLGEDLIDFPVLVSLDAELIDYSATQPGGADLRFVDDEGRVLAHEIERWQPGGVSTIWVRLPKVEERSRKTITYFYGSSTAKPFNNGALVFSADYEAVYHLSDDLAVARVVRDSLDDHPGEASSSIEADNSVAGRTGNGLNLEAGDVVRFDGLASDSETALTLELWVEPKPLAAERRLLCRDSNTNPAEPVACLGIQDGRGAMQLTTMGADGRYGSALTDNPLRNGWTHLALVWSGEAQTVRIYVNGSEDFSFQTMGKVLADSLMPWVLGDASAEGPGPTFSGVVDEVRISRVARSGFWLLATYSIVDRAALLTRFGPQQSL